MCDHVDQVRQLLDDVETQRKREMDAFREGFVLGHREGWDLGYAFRCHEEEGLWAALRERVRSYARLPIKTNIPRDAQ